MASIGIDGELLPKLFVTPGVTPTAKAALLVRLHRNLGTKKDPTILEPGIQIHPDSCGIEFTTPVCSSGPELADAVDHAVDLLSQYTETQYVFVDSFDVAELVEPLMAMAPDVLQTIMARGCDPDWIIRTPGEPPVERGVPLNVLNSTYMELGGHMHVDVDPDYAEDVVCLISHELQRFHARAGDASWYRLPRVYRYKPYGIEYRSLGASWLAHRSSINLVHSHLNNILGALQ